MKIRVRSQEDGVSKIALFIFYPLVFIIFYFWFWNSDHMYLDWVSYYFFIPVLIGSPLFVAVQPTYYIYEDRIEGKNIFGISNVVYFKNIIRIKEVCSKDLYYYVFDDGRKDDNYNSIYNRPIYNLRLNKTKQLEKFILNDLKMDILRFDSDGNEIDNG